MPLEVDLSDDHEVWDTVETISYFAKTVEKPPQTGVPVEGTLWLAIRKDRLLGDSILAQMDLTVNLAVGKLGEIVPKTDDIMQRADGTRWIIKLVEFVAAECEFRVHVKMSRKGT